MKLPSISLLTITLTFSASLLAQQDSHQHGVAELNLVLDQDVLMIEFESPAANIVGFEYEATTAAEIAAISAAIIKLKNPQNLVSLPANAGCKPQESQVELHSGSEDEHEDEHGHAEHDEGHEEQLATGHSEFHATYAFTCTQADRLSDIPLLFFKQFPALEEIHLQAITPWGQTGDEVNAKDPVIRLK